MGSPADALAADALTAAVFGASGPVAARAPGTT
ncbi:MAG: hypothetical protein JWP82_2427 [Humibacillus sp.]|nr:hypothetical protein [Humibacillus sp.]